MNEGLAIRAFFDEPTNTISYLIWDRETKNGAVVDPVLDFDHRSGKASTASVDEILAAAQEEGVGSIQWVLETHAHADHLTAMLFFKQRYGARTVTGSRVGAVQRIFRDIYNLGSDFPVDGRQFDFLLDEAQELEVGSFRVRAMHTPAHTPAHRSW